MSRSLLSAQIPPSNAPSLTSDEVLDRFVSYVSTQGLSLYPAQEEALLELLSGKHLVLATPTGSGKSLVAMFLHFKAMAEGKVSFYTCPIKALVNEKFFALCEVFGPENVGMMTGDAAINRNAPIICATAEILANLALRQDTVVADYVIMDEFHYYADKERGTAWQIPLLSMPETTFLLMSATLGDMTFIKSKLTERTGRECAEIKNSQRPVPLEFTYVETPLHETLQDLLARGKAPVYLVNFTQKAAVEQAQNLLSIDFNTKEEKQRIKQALGDARFDSPFGKDLQRFLFHGLGIHHAGLLPRYRRTVEKLAQSGLLKVISGTDTLGVGVNIPIRTVLITQLCKFDGEKTAILPVRDFLQVAGRAGRKGFDVEGDVVVQAPEHIIENLRLAQKKAQGKKVVMQKPPQKGYAHWDKSTFDRLLSQPPEPLKSRFSITHGLLLNLLQAAQESQTQGYKKLIQLIDLSHERDFDKKTLKKQAAVYFRSLRNAGIVQLERRTPTLPAHVVVQPHLQHDFSLHHTLSLYLVEALPSLDAGSPTYALDILSLVESILESPMAVLYAQLDVLKGEKIAEMKAAGMEYEERMEELEKLEWPKPLRDFIYDTFNAFSAMHPWVGQENIRPKSIAREMYEKCSTFHEYVRDYSLQRSEGILLRYLSECFKTLAQTVPEAMRTPEVEDVIEFLHTTLRHTDSSLIEEWELMRNPEQEFQPLSAPERTKKPQLADAQPKTFAARVRSEMHRLVKALSKKDYTHALECLAPGEWTEKDLEAQLQGFWEEYAHIDVTPKARKPEYTHILSEGDHQYVVRQTLLDDSGHGDWMVECTVDVRLPWPDEAPLLALRRLGT